MASLYFYYSAMNAGKTTHLLQADYNYNERNMNTIIFQKNIYSNGFVEARIGIKKQANLFDDEFDFYNFIKTYIQKVSLDIIFIDESQFLLTKQVFQLAKIVDNLNIPVMCYGLRTDFLGQLFEGSAKLLAIADNVIEIKTMCFCGKKATMTARLSSTKNKQQALKEGEKISIEKTQYISFCRKHYYEKIN